MSTAGLLALLGGALLGGLLLNVMPCVFPILSLKALSLAGTNADGGKARRDGLAYTAGVILACLALGAAMLGLRAAGEQVGWAFQLQEPLVVAGLLMLAIAITANLAGLYELPMLTGRSGGGSAFATGLLAAFVATPCTGPFMAAAMGAALVLPPAAALAVFGALGLGLALPFLALALVPPLRRLMPHMTPAGAVTWTDKDGLHMKAIAPFPGATMIGTDPLGGLISALPAMGMSYATARKSAARVEEHARPAEVVPARPVQPIQPEPRPLPRP
jgi:cytochrome c biogenesis protein CcdA